MSDRALTWPARVRVWDAALAAVRGHLRGQGLREVSTPIAVEAVALEPWIEPIACGSSSALLATSPELAMKQLLARGSGSVFQIAHVFRAAERGARHREEFHLIEWYRECEREPAPLEPVMRDVEQIVAAVFEAVGRAAARDAPARCPKAPARWERVALLELMGETLGCALVGDEPADALEAPLRHVRSSLGLGLDGRGPTGPDDPALAQLLAWTELFSLWSDAIFEPWLVDRGPEVGIHVEGFPACLAALAALDPSGRTGGRFESHVGGVELANGYRELRDPTEQRRRFELVAAMRADHGRPELALPEAFLAELDRLPSCTGVALGLDRLVALACGCDSLDQVALDPRAAG